MHFFVCCKSKKKKKKIQKNSDNINKSSLPRCCILNEGLLTQDNQYSLHTSSSSFSHDKSKTY